MDFPTVGGDGGSERGPYKMRTIARLTDFSPALLRAWERRHKILQPLRGPGGHRLYTDDDLQVLLRVRELIRQGRSIGEIASGGRDSLLRHDGPSAEPPPPVAAPQLAPSSPEMKAEMDRCCKLIVQAALAMDSGAVNRALDDAFARVSSETAIFEVIKPSAQQIGELWAAGRCTVASEHLASGIFVHRLRKLVESAEPAHSQWPPVIVACFPDEYHQLGALIVAYLMVKAGARVSFLGAALPFEDLESACDVLEPSTVLLSVTRQAVFQLHRKRLAETVAHVRGRQRFFVGGMGAAKSDPLLERAGATIIAPDLDPDEALQPIIAAVREAPRRRLR